MTGSLKPLAIIPARGGSKRLPRKNLMPLNGKPLIAYTIEAALESGVFERVCVSTEDEEIAEVARKYGAEVPFMRPAALASDSATNVQVCLHALDFYKEHEQLYKLYYLLQPTSPLRTPEDITQALALLGNSDADSVVSVVPWEHPPFWALDLQDGFILPHWGEGSLVSTQQLPELWRPTGAIFIGTASILRGKQNLYTSRTLGYEMPPSRSVDIDSFYDWHLAEYLLMQNSVERTAG
jgi:CMP-N,N'-diacetyllegionaminic acid synthase